MGFDAGGVLMIKRFFCKNCSTHLDINTLIQEEGTLDIYWVTNKYSSLGTCFNNSSGVLVEGFLVYVYKVDFEELPEYYRIINYRLN